MKKVLRNGNYIKKRDLLNEVERKSREREREWELLP